MTLQLSGALVPQFPHLDAAGCAVPWGTRPCAVGLWDLEREALAVATSLAKTPPQPWKWGAGGGLGQYEGVWGHRGGTWGCREAHRLSWGVCATVWGVLGVSGGIEGHLGLCRGTWASWGCMELYGASWGCIRVYGASWGHMGA